MRVNISLYSFLGTKSTMDFRQLYSLKPPDEALNPDLVKFVKALDLLGVPDKYPRCSSQADAPYVESVCIKLYCLLRRYNSVVFL